MVVYNFKSIGIVPDAKQLVDIVLSMTQRKTPTVVHKGYKISRIRKFYMRKVKYTSENYCLKLDQIIQQFPVLNLIHPFYSDLINILYSRDHYKLALGQLSTVRTTIDNINKDYIKLLKFADSLYRAKELKRAALGRMSTAILKCQSSLVYLEQVRQHLSRLPSIDPSSRTLLICGYPNVGKSSFVNKISNANVEVQNYAFTTKSLYVGHFDYKYTRWQVIDTPGILDHPLDERNTIEMQAITALAHLYSSILYFIDISETCGYTLDKQVSLFHSIKPLFANKPVIIVCNKTDMRKMDELNDEEKSLLDSIKQDQQFESIQFIEMSNIAETGIQQVITVACDTLMSARVERKLSGKTVVNNLINRLNIIQPQQRDNKQRNVYIPDTVIQARQQKAIEEQNRIIDDETNDYRELIADKYRLTAVYKNSKTKREQDERGGSGVYNYDSRLHWLDGLLNKQYAYDIVPEIMDGRNISDYIDPDIEAKLAELEREEDMLLAEYDNIMSMNNNDSDLDDDEQAAIQQIRDNKKLLAQTNALRKSTANKPRLPRTVGILNANQAAIDFDQMGYNTDKFIKRTNINTAVAGQKRKRTISTIKGNNIDNDMYDNDNNNNDNDDITMNNTDESNTQNKTKIRKLLNNMKQARLAGVTKTDRQQILNDNTALVPTGLKDNLQAKSVTKLIHKQQGSRNNREKTQRLGESDRRHFTKMPKHLFSGKRGIGKTDYR